MYDDALLVLNKDKKLKKIISSVGECKIRTISNPFEALVEAIITQQISDSAGKSISLKFKNLFGKKYPTPSDVIKLSKDKIQSVGLSKMKAEYIFDISQMVVNKKLNFQIFKKMSDEDVIAELTKIRGIGKWTAQMYLIFALGRMDVFPLGDLGLINGIKKLYGLENPSTDEILGITNNWIPYRTIGTWYIWRGVKNFQFV
ncbi:MAG: DNA-3-methyladenine glycosylase [Candidatus Nitrosopumilus limneticus]|nr:DNA-3-methyladenine glycosylase II [Candidatus Nitrosopumilus limneticus]MDC4212758.1 DNA-3-methyladenine glycosylase [Candidatus Nitrosopumilus limneticus]MDC4213566.1 DNA-3-methyladenine glycosylase [Candidatus Nitrosopumilus limneticus]MDC4215585.1 DNA-3-methyladenine glycosylase [Candidatus Nitrosopumilus limneticus]MDC4216818.1 DNA-3-methyladenine glycosylase [Candidatus Nitrosopumilus limneticus]